MKKQDCQFGEIPLVEIGTNPRNPRKSFAGPKFDELVASVKEKGVIEPIIVRPVSLSEMRYQIVAGERRFRAAEKVGHETIPAIIRDLTDEQAFDFMLIENLQREDLTEFEEAESFKLYVGKHGKDGIPALAQKTGISPQYIRRRMTVLELPGQVLEAWKKGRLKYGHLEQLLRVKDTPVRLKEFSRLAAQVDRWDGVGRQTTVEELKRRIDAESPALSLAYFPIMSESCESCPKNSMVQRNLFGIEDAQKSHCLDPACFKKRQNDWLLAHWRESPPGKKYGTAGFRFRDKVGYNDHETIGYSFTPDAKCKACPHFLTVIDDDGRPVQGDEQECFNKACLRGRTAKARGEERSKKGTERKPGEPRVSWHGEYFRDLFLKRRIPEVVKTLEPDGEKARTLLLAMTVHENSGVRDVVGTRLKAKDPIWETVVCLRKLLALPYAEVKAMILEALNAKLLQGCSQPYASGYSDGFGIKERLIVSKFLGVDIGKEFAIDEDYLQKKTKAEILEAGRKLKIFADPKAKDYLQKKLKGRDVEKLKKLELVDLVLKSGVELKGKVPAEILREPK